MDLITTYGPGQQVHAAELNAIQAHAVGGVVGSTNNAFGGAAAGARWCWWYANADMPNGTLLKIDSQDWHDRYLFVDFVPAGAGSETPGQPNDYLCDHTPSRRAGYTGHGAMDAGGIAAPTPGNPPVPASTVSWALQLVSGLWLYADWSVGFALTLYNATGSAIRTPMIRAEATSPLGAR